MKPSTGQNVLRSCPSSPASSADAESGLSIVDVVQMLVRRKWFIVGSTLVCGLAAFVYSRTIIPEYEATATIRIDQERANSLGLGDLGGSQGGAPADIQTEIAILQSDQIAVTALSSLSNEDFKRFSGLDKARVMTTSLGTPSSTQDAVVAAFKADLHVKEVGETQLVAISYKGPNPELAATLVNHVVAAYLRENFQSRYGSVSQAKEWLSEQMAGLKDRATKSQAKLADFQEQNGILSTTSSNTTTDTLKMLDERVASAQADRIVKEAQMRAASSASPAVLASMFPDPKLQALQGEQTRLFSQYSQLSSKFGNNYTPLAEVKQQMQAVDKEITQDVDSVRSRLRQEFSAAKNNEDMLRAEYNDQTQKAYAMNREQAELAVLQSEGNASRELYNTLEYKLQQAGVDAGLNGVNTMQIDSARPPAVPVGPQKLLLIGFGTALGFIVGIGAVFLVEMSVDSVQTEQQLQLTTGYYVLPSIQHVSLRSGELPTVALGKPRSTDAEVFRKLRNMLTQSGAPGGPKTLLIASAEPDEGKSLITSNYGVVLAQTGAKVLLVDADLRRPSLHDHFAVENGKGLSEALMGESRAEFRTPVTTLPNLTILTAGREIELPSEALGSAMLRSLLEVWENQFDYIVLKGAPLLLVSDCLPLASWADAVVLVTRQEKTRLKSLKKLKEVLDRVNANVVGIIMNDATHSLGADINSKYGRGDNAN
jgi:succinoglycan biosynthesis transport protein ExoP